MKSAHFLVAICRDLAAIVCICSACLSSLSASPGFQLEIDSIEGDDWFAGGLNITIQLLSSKYANVRITADSLELADPVGIVSNAVVHCPEALVNVHEVLCEEGVLEFSNGVFGKQQLPVMFSWSEAQQIKFSFKDFELAGGRLTATGQWLADRWQVDFQSGKLRLDSLKKLASRLDFPLDVDLAGLLKLQGYVAGHDAEAESLKLAVDAEQVAYSNNDSTQAGENLVSSMNVNVSRSGSRWEYLGEAKIHSGQLYSDPVFLDVQKEPLTFSSGGTWNPVSRRVQIDNATYRHPQTLHVAFDGDLDYAGTLDIRNSNIKIIQARFPQFYTSYVQPFTIGTMLDDMDSQGQISGQVSLLDNSLTRLDLDLRALSFHDNRNLFALDGINSRINWQAEEQPLNSNFSMSGGQVYGIPLGVISADLETRSANIGIVNPVSIPVLDGEVRVSKFQVKDIGSESLSWTLDAALTPISLDEFTRTVDWPRMSGKISGAVPNVSFHKASNSLKVDGALLIRAFDGSVVINNLMTRDLFGAAPLLNADMYIRNIDLKELTQTFSFGRVEGKLEGSVSNLQLVNWQPVSFDAKLQTPPDSKAKRRISQRAVDNLTQLGNGVSGALSTSFLRFFEDFSYRRLGISCILRNGICDMQGVEPAKNGYYIVKGSGIPRIDVIGHNRNVSWTVLIDRLMNINAEKGPVIE